MSDKTTSQIDPVPPFVLELRGENVQPTGSFTPQAAVLLTPALCRSDLLNALSPDDLRTLLAVLSCLTPNGTFCATPELVAPALGLSTGQAQERLQRLTGRHWQNKPLISEQPVESGLHFFVPSPALIAVRQACVLPPEAVGRGYGPFPAASDRPMRGGFRDEIIERNRALYARPRAEVEAGINRFLRGEPMEEEVPATPEEEARLHLKRQLVAIGLTREEAAVLMDGYPHDRIQQQIDWLPLRHARNPAAFLLAAIEGGYEPPLAVRMQRLQGSGANDGEAKKGTAEQPAQSSEVNDPAPAARGNEADAPTAEVVDTAGPVTLDVPPANVSDEAVAAVSTGVPDNKSR